MANLNFFEAKFPKIYRFITDKKLLYALKLQFLLVIYSLLVFLILILAIDLFGNIQKQKEINFQRKILLTELRTWQSIAEKFKGYKEAYYQLAVIEYRLRNFEEAKFYLKKALFLDPNFEKARELEKLLDKI